MIAEYGIDEFPGSRKFPGFTDQDPVPKDVWG
jgi:hypothetical protein